MTRQKMSISRYLVSIPINSQRLLAVATFIALAGCSGSTGSAEAPSPTSSASGSNTSAIADSPTTSAVGASSSSEIIANALVPLRSRPFRDGEIAESLLLQNEPGVSISSTGCITFIGEDGRTYGWIAPPGSTVVGNVLSYPTLDGIFEAPLDSIRPSRQEIGGEELEAMIDDGQSVDEACPGVEVFTIDNRYFG